MTNGSGGPRAFWEREHGSAPASSAAAPRGPLASPARREPTGLRELSAPPPTDPAQPPGAPAPAGPPARVGGAVAALVVAVLSVAGPALMVYLEYWFFLLAVNLPGIGFGIAALTRLADPAAVERYIRYTWACTFAYAALFVLFTIPLAVIFAVMFLLTY
ncbi:hypothetical protein [Nocardiopsis sp. FR6]|uniref:hypothetical protein n=1 Tax=unclassified Nocardiopsis TaxID=2649073 RepID=UPI00351A2F90